MTRSSAEMCLWLQWLDKQGAYMKMNVIRHCTLFSHTVIHFDTVLSHNSWQPASWQGNILATEFKDSIYIDQSSFRLIAAHRDEKKSCRVLRLGWKFWIKTVLWGFTLWPFWAAFKQLEKILWPPNILLKPHSVIQPWQHPSVDQKSSRSTLGPELIRKSVGVIMRQEGGRLWNWNQPKWNQMHVQPTAISPLLAA